MRKVVVFTHLTLDGVMQAPGRPDEDPLGGFEHGGWALPYNDEVMGRRMGEGDGPGRSAPFRTTDQAGPLRPSRLGRGPMASAVLSSPPSSRARRSVPLRRRSTPPER